MAKGFAVIILANVLFCGTFASSECRRMGHFLVTENERMEEYIIDTKNASTKYQCAELCLYRRMCRSVNFQRLTGKCELNCQSKEDIFNRYLEDPEYMYIDMNNVSATYAGNCANHECPDDYICVPGLGEEFVCAPSQIQLIRTLAEKIYDFETGLCGWTQDDADDVDWKRKSGKTSTLNTGPSGDHTTGQGYYMYLEASGLSPGDKSRLISDVLPGGRHYCLEFWYQMYAQTSSRMGTLNVYTQIKNRDTLLFTKTGSQGKPWVYAALEISSTLSEPFVIIFEAIMGINSDSDICIDDVSITENTC